MLILVDDGFLCADHDGKDKESEEYCRNSDGLDPGQVTADMQDLHQGLSPTWGVAMSKAEWAECWLQ